MYTLDSGHETYVLAIGKEKANVLPFGCHYFLKNSNEIQTHFITKEVN